MKIAITDFKIYFYDKFNYIDVLLLALVITMSFINMHEKDTKTINLLNFFSTLLLNLRAFSEFRVFDNLRYLIALMERIFLDIRYFLITMVIMVLIYFLMLMGVNRIYDRNNDTYYHADIAMKLGLGS